MFKKFIIFLCILLSVLFMGGQDLQAKQTCAGKGDNALTGEAAQGCINSTEFFINTNTIAPGGGHAKFKKNSTQATANAIFSDIIQNMIVVFGVLSLIVMTIGGGYMIFHSGEESLLSRGKTIFMYGLISLVVALSSGILVKLVTYLLY